MRKGRSTYTFQLNCDPNLVNNLIQGYIQGNKYELQNKNGEQFYKTGDSIIGYRCFNYSISGQMLTICAWLQGNFGDDMMLEQSNFDIVSMKHRNSFVKLFEEIEKLNDGGMNNNGMSNNGMNLSSNPAQQFNQNISNDNMNLNQGQPVNGQSVQNNTAQLSQTFLDDTIKKQEKMCNIAFWISLFGVLAALMGVMYGIILYIFDFYWASQGLKTKKRGKAIATIVLSIISILIIFIQLIAI